MMNKIDEKVFNILINEDATVNDFYINGFKDGKLQVAPFKRKPSQKEILDTYKIFKEFNKSDWE